MFTPKTVKNFFNFNTQPFNNTKKKKEKQRTENTQVKLCSSFKRK